MVEIDIKKTKRIISDQMRKMRREVSEGNIRLSKSPLGNEGTNFSLDLVGRSYLPKLRSVWVEEQ